MPYWNSLLRRPMCTLMSDVSQLRTYAVGDQTLYFAEQGDGVPLVLIHGSLCDARYWRAQMGPLAAGAQVLAPSLRHCWPMPWDGRGEGYAVTTHADDVAALLARLGHGPAHILGHSRGARVAVELARRHRHHVRSLILADPGLLAMAADDSPGAQARRRAMAQVAEGDIEDGLACFIDTVSGRGTWRHMVPWFKAMVRDNAHTLIVQAAEAAPPLHDADLGDMSMPTLLIGGDHSPAPFPAALERLRQTMPDTRLVRIPHASHGMNLANPRAFNAAVRAFVQRVG